MTDAPCERLAWDSAFFGMSIARARASRVDAAAAAALLEWCRAHAIDCLYFLRAAGDSDTRQVLESSGFAGVDERVTLELRRPPGAATAPGDTRPARPADVPRLRAIAAVSHQDSRFYKDGHFDRLKCDELYRTWIERSCNGWADHVLVAEREGSPAGYLTVHLRGSEEAALGLMAVAPEFRRQGVAASLMAGAFAWLDGRSITRVSVVTQGSSVAPLELYRKLGFRISCREAWHHRWLGERRPA
jgi:dTDP-4-amino-4,6-dideoxy-D-galactose acyltransferase